MIPVSYVLGATTSGPMIMMRWDTVGVSNELLQTGAHEQAEIDHVLEILDRIRRKGAGHVVAIDGGANVGTWTIQMAKAMKDWGEVHSFEPQRRLYYALCGNVALNNCHNVHARNEALGCKVSTIDVIQLPADRDNQMSTLNLQNQTGGYPREFVPEVTIDSLGLHVDLIKLDIEGMETKALRGAQETIKRCRPVVFAEIWMSEMSDLHAALPGYRAEVLPEPRNAIFWPE